ncbi:hypothetical protein C0995_003266 [Termitomyces sp. Mi166|nr:hypothetical protein C0995_003266 [Termitomyces sp. Mi166\
MFAFTWVTLSVFVLAARAGTTLWSGNFNDYATVADFDKCTGHGLTKSASINGGSTSRYLALDPSYKNPADTAESHGLKLTIDSTSNWNGQTMERSELIPQTTANLGSGNLFYHFSVKHSATNPPNLKYGVGSNPTDLVWMVTGVEKWSTPFTADTWFNFAYDIDFSAGTVGLWASTGSSPLTKVVANIAASTSTNSADWHLGVLRLVTANDVEDWYFSGVYVESGPITTTVGSGSVGTTSSSPSTTVSSTSTTLLPTTTTSSTATAPSAVASHYGQCGGTGYTGPTVCASPYTCTAVAPPYYYQYDLHNSAYDWHPSNKKA